MTKESFDIAEAEKKSGFTDKEKTTQKGKRNFNHFLKIIVMLYETYE